MRLPLPQFAVQSRHPDHVAEVIETSTTEFLAQCLEPDSLAFPTMPEFGSWLTAQDEDSGNQIYGVVYHATTSPIDSVHRARALGLSLDDLREQQPQIFAMLKTEFRVAIVGFRTLGTRGKSQGSMFQHLPPRPPRCIRRYIVATQMQYLSSLNSLTLCEPCWIWAMLRWMGW
jgi:hypothetical protein